MTSSLKTAALLFLALGAAAPTLGQDRPPRAGAPAKTVTVTETAPAIRKPRSGATVAAPAPASTELAGAVLVGSTDAVTEFGLCGRKYCGAASAR